MTLWTDHITKFSKKHNISLKEAMSNPKCKREYEKMKKKKGIISPKKKNKKRLNYGVPIDSNEPSGPPGPGGPGGPGGPVPDPERHLRSDAEQPVIEPEPEPETEPELTSPKIFKPSKRRYNRKKK